MRSLQLSRDVKMPLDAVTQTFAVLGKRGSGKTNTASVLTEQFVKANLPVVYVDPIGVTWGLRHSRDGKGPGLPVIILGGEHADVPLEEAGGAVIADFVIDHRQPVVLDLGLFSKSAQRRFMVDFTERLYHKNRDAMHVMLDECDTFVPQRIDHGGERLVGAINDLVRKGRARGLGVTLISQRPALVNKDVLTQVEVLVAHRMTGPQDRDAIERWIEHNADDKQGKEVLSSLQALEDGDAWVWSPSFLGKLVRTHVNLRETFDSSATPKAGARVVAPKHAAEVDLGALRDQLAATIEKAKADDPRELRRRIVELEKQQKKGAPAPGPTKTVEVPVITKVQEKLITALRGELGDVQRGLVQLDRKLEALTGVYGDHRKDVLSIAARVAKVAEGLVIAPPALAPRPARPEPARTVSVPLAARVASEPTKRRDKAAANGDGADKPIGKGEREVLTAIAQNPDGAARDQISALTGFKQQTRDTYISRLVARGMVDAPRGELVKVTEDGMAELGPSFKPLPTGEELIDHWMKELPEGEGKIFQALVDAGSDGVERETLTDITGFGQQTRDTYISRLIRRRIVQKPQRGMPVVISKALLADA